ncbi:bifunctional diguanylate cyclase/phosphodiesterase [Massilia sp. TN1-12]|uniref:bifunctional diguanylate cyclase/phosphodiesterase n=1 Tax=Massilia paldalensis TaxID=3377675 RepID=UPI00384F6FEE
MLTPIAPTARARMRLPAAATLLTLLAGLVVTAVLFTVVRDAEIERERAEFLQRAEVRKAAVTRSLGGASDILRAVNSLFAAVGIVGRDEFAAFVGPLLDDHAYLCSVVFHRLVADAARPAYEAERRALDPGFAFRERQGNRLVPASNRQRYLVVDYVAPLAGNEFLLGYDVLASPGQGPAFAQALRAGRAASTGLMPLLQQPDHLALILMLPVYAKDVPRNAATVLGNTSVVIDVAVLLDRSMRGSRLLERGDMTIELYGPSAMGSRLAYRREAAPGGRDPWWLAGSSDTVFRASRAFTFAGQPWELRMAGYSGRMMDGTAPLLTLVLGGLASVAVAAWVEARVQRTRRIERLVRRRTADLRSALDGLRLYRRAIDASANAIILISATRPGYPIEYVNPAFVRMRKLAPADVVGRPLHELGMQEPDQAAVAELRAAIRARREAHVSMRLRCGDGREIDAEVYIAPVFDDDGATDHFVMTQYDVSTARRYEAELETRARFDTLTGLPNRSLLHDRIDGAINAAAGRANVWVAALDLDHFKFVNDTMGHEAGDELLKAAAARIAGAIGRGDTAARTGGDEFVLVLPGRETEGEAAATVRAVLEALAHPLVLRGQNLVMTGSAGVAVFPADGNDAATLVQHAEVAMYRAKEVGRNTVQFFTPAMNARARDRLALEGALRSALLQDEFELFYQPQVDLGTGSVVGLEALIRWRHPSLGMVRPDRFINLAEETGLIVPIGSWVLRTACRQHRDWQHAGYGPLRIAVNLSARQFAEPGLVREIARVLEETGMAAGSLEVEITESLVMADVEGAIRTMGELKAMGVKLSIDDFGTGYSSLSYLRRFPVDVLKIDRSFVRDIASSPDDAALVSAIIELARGLHMRVIAEGVETLAQLDYLRRRGCDEVQGHVFARAASGPEVEALLRNGRHVRPHGMPA